MKLDYISLQFGGIDFVFPYKVGDVGLILLLKLLRSRIFVSTKFTRVSPWTTIMLVVTRVKLKLVTTKSLTKLVTCS